jgi:hypothetical protein
MKFRSLAVAAALMLASFAAWSQTLCIAPLVVNNVADSGCGSLRNAIQFANSPAILTAGPTGACPIVTASGPTITFDTSAGPLVIKPATPLPALTCTYGVNIDGGGTANTATQGSTNAVIKVEIDGSACVDPSFARGPVQQKTVGACDGLHVQSSATIRGLAVHSFAGSAIVVDSGGLDLYGNFLGTDATGIAAGKGNGQAGVLVNAGSLFAGGASGPGDRNLISGNAGPGVHVMDGGSSLHLVDNLIGGDRNGGAGLTNDSAGVFIEGTAGISALISNNDIRHNLGYGISTSRNNVEVRQNIIALNGGDSLVNVAPVDPPLIQSFTYDGTNTTVIVTTQNFGFGGVVDLFSNPSFTPTTPPTEPEGQVYLTPLSTSSTTDTIARTWTIVVPGELSFPTATFTGSCDCSTSPTSEYSDPAFPPLAEVVPTAGTVGVGVQTSVTVVLFNANSLQTLSNIVATYSVPSPLQLGSGGVTYTGECGSAISPTANGFQVANLTLSPGGQCTIQVPVFSSTPGLHPTGSVDNITSSLGVGGTIGSTPLLVVAPALQLDASTLFFPNQDVGTTSAPQSVFINNIGTSDLSVTSVVSSAPSEFIVTGCTSALVAPAAPACIFNVAFSPAAGGARSATITISSNDASSPHIVSVGGNGIVPAPALTPANFSFGNVPVGGSANSTFAIANPTSVPIPITISLSATGFSSATTCPATLAAGASCTVTVTFAPASVTPYSATLQVQSSATTPSVVSAVISGNGTATLLPVLSASPGALSFGVQAVATTSPAQNVVVKNTGNAALNIGAVTFAGGDFSGSGCAGLSIAPGSFCTISVTFTPTASGTRAGTLTIASNDAASPATVALSGTGGTAGVVFAPASLTFPRQGVGTTSAPQSVVLTNNGNSDLQITSISATGDFGYTGCGFPLTLVSGASCTFSVTFSPLSNGVLTGAITVADNAPGSPHQLALSGTGANGPQPSLAVRPSSLDFGDARIGSQRTDTVTITSNGSAPLRSPPSRPAPVTSSRRIPVPRRSQWAPHAMSRWSSRRARQGRVRAISSSRATGTRRSSTWP